LECGIEKNSEVGIEKNWEFGRWNAELKKGLNLILIFGLFD
jgi:hypothetical protein